MIRNDVHQQVVHHPWRYTWGDFKPPKGAKGKSSNSPGTLVVKVMAALKVLILTLGTCMHLCIPLFLHNFCVPALCLLHKSVIPLATVTVLGAPRWSLDTWGVKCDKTLEFGKPIRNAACRTLKPSWWQWGRITFGMAQKFYRNKNLRSTDWQVLSH